MWLSNSQAIIRTAARLQRNIIDMESDLRGFLLTGDYLFKNSYRELDKENHALYSELKDLIIDNSFQKKKLDTILVLQEKWKLEVAIPLFAEDTMDIIRSRNYYKNLSRSIIDKDIRRNIIHEFKEFNNYEYELRDKRKTILTASITGTRELSFSLTIASIFLGLIVAIYLTKVIS
jgi:CHASE3 domain sensor protein